MFKALRDYQEKGIADLRVEYAAGRKRPCWVAPTGAGKTEFFLTVVERAAKKGRRSILLVHREHLIEQISQRLVQRGIRHGIIAPGQPQTNDLVQVASVFTLARRIRSGKFVPAPQLIVVDEAHHAVAGEWAFVLNYYDCQVLGVTATPARLDGTGLFEIFDSLVLGPTIQYLIDRGYLTKPITYAPPPVADFTGLKKQRSGDYAAKDLAERTDKPTITGDAIAHYKRICPGKRAVAFCCDINHAQHVEDEFNKAGIPAAALHSKLKKAERKAILDKLDRSEILVVVTVDLVNEGWDVPGLECAILLRRTASMVLFCQQVGRVLRTAPGKKFAYILDHVGNTYIHGLAEMDRSDMWTLAGVEKANGRSTERTERVAQCEKCYACLTPPIVACPECGHIPEVKVEERKVLDVDLVAVDEVAVRREMARRRKMEERACKDVASLAELGRARGYKHPTAWAKKFHEHREKTKEKYKRDE